MSRPEFTPAGTPVAPSGALDSLADIPARIDALRASRIRPGSNGLTNRASAAGDPCERRMVYERTHGAQKQPHSPRLQGIFDLGRLFEGYAVAELAAAGIPLLEREVSFIWHELQLSGHIDGTIEVDGERILVDVKSMSPHVFAAVHTAADLRSSTKRPWLLKYTAQLALYMLMKGKGERSAIIAVNKATGEFKVIPYELDWDEADALVKKLERVNAHVAARTLPEQADPADGHCEGCPFAHICLPDTVPTSADGMALATSDEFVSALDRRAELAPYAKEFTVLDGVIKEQARAAQWSGKLLAGAFVLSRRTTKRKAYTVEAAEYETITISTLKGEPKE